MSSHDPVREEEELRRRRELNQFLDQTAGHSENATHAYDVRSNQTSENSENRTNPYAHAPPNTAEPPAQSRVQTVDGTSSHVEYSAQEEDLRAKEKSVSRGRRACRTRPSPSRTTSKERAKRRENVRGCGSGNGSGSGHESKQQDASFILHRSSSGIRKNAVKTTVKKTVTKIEKLGKTTKDAFKKTVHKFTERQWSTRSPDQSPLRGRARPGEIGASPNNFIRLRDQGARLSEEEARAALATRARGYNLSSQAPPPCDQSQQTQGIASAKEAGQLFDSKQHEDGANLPGRIAQSRPSQEEDSGSATDVASTPDRNEAPKVPQIDIQPMRDPLPTNRRGTF